MTLLESFALISGLLTFAGIFGMGHLWANSGPNH